MIPYLRLGIAAAALLSAFISGGIVGKWRGDAALERARADHAAALVQATEQARERERAVLDKVQVIADDAQKLVEDLARDAARARAAGDGLRDAASRAAAACGSASSAATAAGASAGAAGALLAELLTRADETAGVLAAALDRSHAAGRACEASYEAVRR